MGGKYLQDITNKALKRGGETIYTLPALPLAVALMLDFLLSISFELAFSFSLKSHSIVKNVTRRVVLYVYSEGSESYTAILRVLRPSYTYMSPSRYGIEMPVGDALSQDLIYELGERPYTKENE